MTYLPWLIADDRCVGSIGQQPGEWLPHNGENVGEVLGDWGEPTALLRLGTRFPIAQLCPAAA